MLMTISVTKSLLIFVFFFISVIFVPFILAEPPITTISITSDKHVYEKNQTVIISINNEDSSNSAIFNFALIDPNGKEFEDECVSYEKPLGNMIQPFSTAKITWNTKNCKVELVEGNWIVSSHFTSENKLADLITSIEIKIVGDIEKYNSSPSISYSQNEIIFRDNPKKGIFKIVFDGKTFDTPYDILGGEIDYLYVERDRISFKIDEFQPKVTLNVKIPNAAQFTDKTCFYERPSMWITRGEGTLVHPFIGGITYSNCQKPLEWTKQDAILWNNGSLSDSHFSSMIQLLIEHKIIDGPTTTIENANPKFNRILSNTITDLPQWLKVPAKWWNQDIISDNEMMDSIEYLIETKVIKFEESIKN
ncbi:MAG: exported protein of unknown function [Nitrosarchaeum sp.]|nr:exported protein of unknown function [Nitrosarchaeum sp.]